MMHQLAKLSTLLTEVMARCEATPPVSSGELHRVISPSNAGPGGAEDGAQMRLAICPLAFASCLVLTTGASAETQPRPFGSWTARARNARMRPP